ncbi:MAG: cytochrome c1 [Alphaproteobacteria bacterium]|nr:cytochrome c1 [Alphaproteobacteria bacterium]
MRAGIKMMGRMGAAAALAIVAGLSIGAARAADDPVPPHRHWSFSGMFGTYDRAALQRGFQVYKEVCAACHVMRFLYYRDLAALGFNEDEIKAIAAGYEVTDGPNDQGEMFKRPGRPADRFVPPFATDNAARAANNGALPPDLSLITKAREHGADYVHALLTGYKDPPAGFALTEGMNYNEYFPGHQIAMAPPLNEGGVTFADNTKSSVDQMAHDIATFLTWAAEPEMEARKEMGIKAILFLVVLSGLLYAVKRKVWKGVH